MMTHKVFRTTTLLHLIRIVLNMPTPLKILVPVKRVIDYAVSPSPPLTLLN